MNNLLSWPKFFRGSNEEENIESLSHEALLKRASEIEYENDNMKKRINELMNETNLLNNSIINKNNNQSEYSKFLDLMQKNLLNICNNNKNNNYDIDTFKKFLYRDSLMYGTMEEDKENYLVKSDKENKLDWENKKENYLLKQNIFEKNLKELYSHMIMSNANITNNKNKTNKTKNINTNKDEDKKHKEELEININKDVNKKNLNEKLNMNIMDEFIGKKKEEEVNVLENILFNEDNFGNDNENDNE